MTATEVRSRWSECLGRADEAGAVLVTRYGNPHVVVVSVERYEALIRRVEAREASERSPPDEQPGDATEAADHLEGGRETRSSEEATAIGSVTVHGDLIAPIDEEWYAEVGQPSISARSLEMADRSVEQLKQGVVGEPIDPECLDELVPPTPDDVAGLKELLEGVVSDKDRSVEEPFYLCDDTVEGGDEPERRTCASVLRPMTCHQRYAEE